MARTYRQLLAAAEVHGTVGTGTPQEPFTVPIPAPPLDTEGWHYRSETWADWRPTSGSLSVSRSELDRDRSPR